MESKTIAATILTLVIAPIAVYWLTTGIREDHQRPPQFNLTGAWSYTGHSTVSGAGCTRNIQLTMEGTSVSGVMSPCDDSKGFVEGSFNASTLSLSRDTGLNAIQKMVLTKQSDNRFVGRYWNEGTSTSKDEGTMEMWR